MPQVMVEKSMVVALNAPKVLTAGVVPPGLVVLHVEAEGVAIYVKFGPDEDDFLAAESVAMSILRCAARARAMAEVAAAPTVPRIVVPMPSNGRG